MPKAAIKPQQAMTFKGEPAHNLKWYEDGNTLYVVVDKTHATRQSKNGKSQLLSTSGGFVTIGEGQNFRLNLNLIKS